jgi:hypothetical protein
MPTWKNRQKKHGLLLLAEVSQHAAILGEMTWETNTPRGICKKENIGEAPESD